DVWHLDDFREIVICDFEYHYGTGGSSQGPPIPVCACALELHSGRQHRLWTDELLRRHSPPWAQGPDVLFISYNAPAELSCFIQLKWSLPIHILDLLIEQRQLCNGIPHPPEDFKLTTTLAYYGLPAIAASDKKDWQQLALTGGPFSAEDREGLLDYC